jgi:TRAP transporter 4TM/12TM fusion protein
MARSILLDPGTWFSVGCRRLPTGWIGYLIPPFAVIIAVYVILAATTIIIDPWVLTAVFLAGMMALAFLTVGATANADTKRVPWYDFVLSLLSIASGIYFIAIAQDEVQRISLLFPLDKWHLVFGTIICLLTIELTRRTTGLGLTAIVLVFVFYNLLGHLLSGVLSHGYINYNHFLDIMVYTTDGIMGLPARVAATYAFMFVMFGTFLYYAKGSDFFYDFASAISGRQVGGPAKVAVVSSGLYGMISGSPTSDVVTTGAITIPMMIRLGYRRSVAAAIEVAGSTGGSLMPPVMGSAAFIMADYTGIEYVDIAKAALLPAVLYYIGVFSQVHFRAYRLGLGGLDRDQIPRFMATLRNGGLFIIPMAVLVWALLAGYTPTKVAVFGTVAVICVAAFRASTRIGLVTAYRVLAETATRMVPVAGACAAAGLVIAGITMTGLSGKFAHVVYMLTGAHVFPTLLLAAALTILLGMGMPTPSAYILAAVLIGPLLGPMHIDLLPGHMFLLYFAVMSALTPPVAVAAYAAASIAEDNPLAIASHAVKFALAALVVPFTFVYGPELLWQGPLWHSAITFITAAAGLILLAMAIEKYDLVCAEWWSRILVGFAGLCMITPFFISTFAGLAIAGGTTATNRLWLRKKQREDKMSKFVLMVVFAIGATLMASNAIAQEVSLTVAAGQPLRAMRPLSMVNSFFVPEVTKRAKAAGITIKWKEAYAGSLLKPTRVLQGVSDGIADIGFSPTIFHPDKLPLEQITFATPFITQDVVLVGKIMDKLHATIPAMAKQYDKFGVIRLAGSSYDTYDLFTTFEMKKFEDIKGKKIATAGAALQWLRNTGATPVQSNMTLYYNNAKTGVIDGFIIFSSATPGMKYPEAAPYVTRTGFGAQYAAVLIINKATFNNLPAKLQKILKDVGKEWTAKADKVQFDAGNSGFAMAKNKFKGTTYELPRAEQVKWANALPNIAKEWADRAEKQGLPGHKVLTAYMNEMRAAGAKPVRDWDKK